MPKVSEEHRQARRRQIADAALRCFARKGFQGTTMADIISESGLSAGAIYGHYTSKNEIAVFVAQDVVTGVVTDHFEADGAEEMLDPADAVGELLTAISERWGVPGVIVQVWAEAAGNERIHELALEVVGRLKRAMSGYLKRWLMHEQGLNAAAATAKARTLLPLLLGVCQGYLVQAALLPDFDSRKYIESIRAIRFN